MFKFLDKNLITIYFFFSFLVLLSAYYIEYVLGYEACNLCLIGRIPYFLVIGFSLYFLLFRNFKRVVLVFIFMSFLSSFLIACYHFGVEQDFFDGTLVCQIKGLGRDISTSELLRELESNKSKSCKDVDFRVFGLSLATINLFISFVLSTITFNKIFKK